MEQRRADRMEEEFLIPEEIPWYQTPFFERLILLALPPVGLVLAYRHPRRSLWRKVLITLLALLWLVPYAAMWIGALTVVGVIGLEFQGGFGPSIVRAPTRPNYAVVAEHRRRQREDAVAPQAAPASLAQLRPYWTDFRGPRRDGHYTEQPVLTDWPLNGPPRLWRQPCGGGYASFVVAEGLAITIEQRWDNEVVVAYELDTGREVWTHEYPALFSEWMGGDGPRATPTYHDGLVFSLGATGRLCCLSAANGTLLWEADVLKDSHTRNLRWGLACSPLVVGKSVVVLAGEGTDVGSVLAYDTLSGRRLWSTLDDRQTYTSPLRVELAGEPQLLIVTATRALGLALDGQRVLWEFPWSVPYDNAIATPVLVGGNRFFLSAGYGVGGAVVEIKRAGDAFVAAAIWRNQNLRTKFNAAVYWDRHLYGLDEGVLACVDAVSGERAWREGRYGYGQLLLADGHLIVLAGDGQLALVEATPVRFAEKAKIQALRGKTWNVPALAHGRLLVRNSAEMACFDLRRPRSDLAR